MSSKPVGSSHDYRILDIISSQPSLSQRELADKSRLSLGMVNIVLQRLIKTGYIKTINLNRRKMRYIVTPKGLQEKATHFRNYVVRTIRAFKDVEDRLQELIDTQIKKGLSQFAILGEGDVAGLARMILTRDYPGVSYRFLPAASAEDVKKDEVILDCRLNESDSIEGISVIESLLNLSKQKKGEMYELV